MYTFLVEDGTGVTDATSYATVLQVDSFAVFWEYPDWQLLDSAAKEKLLIRATRFIDEQFTWPSKRLTTTQGLLWPREPFYDIEGRLVEGIPQDLVEAVSEFAILLEDYSTDDLNNVKKLIRMQFGDSEEEYATPYSLDSNPFLSAYSRISARLNKFGLGGSGIRTATLRRG